MARLTEHEKSEVLRTTRSPLGDAPASAEASAHPPAPPRLTPREYVAFATFASKFFRGTKPVRFGGAHWKL